MPSTVSIPVSQEDHGFSRGTPVKFDGDNWVLASTGEIGVGMVGNVLDSNAFEFVIIGEIRGLTDLVPGAAYYPDGLGYVSTTVNGTSVGVAYSSSILFVQAASAGTLNVSDDGDEESSEGFVTIEALDAAFTSRDLNTESPILGGGPLTPDLTLTFDQTVDLDNNARASVAANDVVAGERRKINFISTATVIPAVTDDSANEEVEVTMTVPPNAVTNAVLAQMPAYTMKANDNSGTADPQDLTIQEVHNMLGVSLGRIIAAAHCVHLR